MQQSRFLASDDSTLSFGAEVIAIVRSAPSSVVLLTGDLGVGKTTLVRGAVAALDRGIIVQSPTFALRRTYATTPPVRHIDLYRFSGAHLPPGAVDELGIFDDLDDDGITFVEWPLIGADEQQRRMRRALVWSVALAHDGDGRRAELRQAER
jgi:tRNA threonylcarbamoyl adenosine modification protein YjeE